MANLQDKLMRELMAERKKNSRLKKQLRSSKFKASKKFTKEPKTFKARVPREILKPIKFKKRKMKDPIGNTNIGVLD